jgi:hypothetical protein
MGLDASGDVGPMPFSATGAPQRAAKFIGAAIAAVALAALLGTPTPASAFGLAVPKNSGSVDDIMERSERTDEEANFLPMLGLIGSELNPYTGGRYTGYFTDPALQRDTSPFSGLSYLSSPGGPFYTPAPYSFNMSGIGSFASIRSSGFSQTDTAAAAPPGSMSPGFRATALDGAVAASSLDASRYFDLPADQRLVLGAFFNYGNTRMTYDASPLAGGLSAGSADRNTYTLGARFGYYFNSSYLVGRVAFDLGRSNMTNNVSGGQGSFDSHGYSADLRLGNIFLLYNSLPSKDPNRITKAPPVAGGGYALAFDASAHIGYFKSQDNGFTDSAGFISGVEQVRFGDVGARGRLTWVIPNAGVAWMPFVGVSVDRLFDFRHTYDVPAQPLAIADTVIFGQDKTYWGGEWGLKVVNGGGVSLGARGFYEQSSDTRVIGGTVSLQVPFATR